MGRVDPQIRDAMLAHLRTHHPTMSRHWFDEIELVELNGGTLKLLVRETVQLKYLQRCCADQFREAAQAVTGRLISVRFVGEDESAHDDDSRANSASSSSAGSSPSPSNWAFSSDDEMLLSPDYSFSNFVVGPENRLAHAGAMAICQKPGRAYNPLFIHGGVGLGKTHLLHAICQSALNTHKGMRIHYTSCNGFMTQFLDAVQDGHMTDFRHRWRTVDLLVVDDIHDLAKRDRTQEEFFHTFNALYQTGRQVVLSSDASPAEIPDLEERLTSRFNSGLVARIDKPGYETRVSIVKSKSALRNLTMPDDVAGYIAARIDSNIREIEGAITSIQSLSLVNNAPIDLELAKAAIGDRSAAFGAATNPSIQSILDAISAFYDVRLTDLLGKRRHKSITLPRQIGMWLARRHTRFSLEEIGSYFGGRDHTTVIHAIRTIENRRTDDPVLNYDVNKIEQRIVTTENSPSSAGGGSDSPLPPAPQRAESSL